MKSTRILIAVTILTALVGGLSGCDIFVASKLGRWNPLDPDNELEAVSRTLSPVIQGYVQDMPPGSYFNAPTLIASDYSDILLVFADLPAYIDSARLQLECLSGSGWIDILPIGRAWSTATVDYAEVESPGFLDWLVIGGGDVPGPGPVTIEVGDVMQRLRDVGNYGIAVRHFSSAVEFDRSPKLIVNGKDIPE